MTSEQVLVLAWLVLAHLVADFVLQTDGMVVDKTSSTRSRRWRGLGRHGGAVALCLLPFALAYGLPGVAVVVVGTVTHVVVDRWKVRATRRAEARALAGAHRRHEAPTGAGGDGLGPAWTPVPGTLFLVDQLLHLGVLTGAWLVFLARAQPLEAWSAAVGQLTPGDEAQFHRWVLLAVLLASLLIVNVRAGALFVATLVRPRESVSGPDPGATASARPADGERATAAVPRSPTGSAVGWRVTVGPIVATAEPVEQQPRPTAVPAHVQAGRAAPARVGATIGVLERLLIVTFVLTGSAAAIGFVVAAKTLARFKQLDDRDFAEYYLLGTLASVAVALGSALLAQAALASLSPG
ncbi:MAG TPA: DUF3307 domain-containing protein [Vitreimonas sp.]|nr:DUF3307 domain-containing protein [Vitreimonas sp.]